LSTVPKRATAATFRAHDSPTAHLTARLASARGGAGATLTTVVGAGATATGGLASHHLAKYNAVRLGKSDFSRLPMCLAAGSAVVLTGSPSRHWWEPPPSVARPPEYRTDSGVHLIAQAFGCRRVIYVKDQDGLYDRDPATHPDAKLISEITARELLDRSLPDLPIEPIVLEMMLNARLVKQVQIVNRLTAGTITQAMLVEVAGTIIAAA
jgi:molybdenum storage protein